MKRNFHPQEEEGKVTGQYVLACIELAKIYFNEKGNENRQHYHKAIEWLERAMHYPENLGRRQIIWQT